MKVTATGMTHPYIRYHCPHTLAIIGTSKTLVLLEFLNWLPPGVGTIMQLRVEMMNRELKETSTWNGKCKFT